MSTKIKGRSFIVGCPRSGTTLLQALLAAHPQIASLPETHFFSHTVGRRWRRLLGLSSPKAKDMLERFLTNIGREELKCLIPKYGFLMRHYTDAFVEMLDRITANENKFLWLEKTPSHLHFINIIEMYVPCAKFIHIIRRGEDVVASMYEVTRKYPDVWGRPRSIEQCVNRWNRDVKISQQYLNNENHIITGYEQLVEDPEGVLRSLCKFIGVEFDLLMLKQHGKTAEKLILEYEDWKKQAEKSIDTANSKNFTNLFDKREQSFIIDHLEKL